MSPENLLLVLTIFVIVSAIALLLQLGTLFGMYKAVKAMSDNVTPLIPQAQSVIATAKSTLENAKQVIDSAKGTVEQSRKQISDIGQKAGEIMDSTKGQIARLDDLVNDASTRAKAQMDRIELVMDDTMSRVHETVALVHNGVLKPLREVNGVTSGVRAALAHFTRGRRPSVANATQDEEMFI